MTSRSAEVIGPAADVVPAPEAAKYSSSLRQAVGLLLWAVAVATALWAQHLLVPEGPVTQGWWCYLLAVVLYVAGVTVMEWRIANSAPVVRQPTRPGRLVRLGTLVLLGAAVIAVGRSVALVTGGSGYQLAFRLWLVGLALSAAALALLAWRRPGLGTRVPWTAARWAEVAVVVAILGFALWLRLLHVGTLPPEVHGDEGMAGIEGRQVLHGLVPNLFGTGWYSHPWITFAISAAFMRVFGDDLFGLRMASVAAGTACVLLVYLLCRRLFSVRVAMVATALFAMAHWHIHFSRIGLVNVQAVFATLLLLWLVVRAVQTGRALDFLLAGFAVGFCFNVYFAARLAPLIAGLYLVIETLRDRRLLRQRLIGVAVMTAGAALFLAPMAAQYAKDPGAFVYRGEVFLFTKASIRHELASYGTDSMLKVVGLQTVHALETFNLLGETSLQHAHKGPLLDFWTSALFVLGLAGVTLRPRAPANGLLAAWFWLTLVIGGILTVDALFSPRVITMAPVLCIVAALAVEAGWRGTERVFGTMGRGVFLVLVLGFLVLAGRANYHTYFVRHVREFQPAGYNTLVSRYIAALGDAYRVYLIGGERLSYETERFLIPDVDGVTVDTPTLTLPLTRVPAERGVAFIVHAARATAWMPLLRAAYPNGREARGLDAAGHLRFYGWLVSHADLVSANPDAVLDPSRIRGIELSRLRPLPGEPSVQGLQSVGASSRPGVAGSVPAPLPPGGRVALTDLVATKVAFGFAPPQLDRAWDGAGALVMGGVTYPKGLGMHAWGRVTFPVPAGATKLEAVIGLADSARDCAAARVTFEIRDQQDRLLFDSGPVDNQTPPRPIDVALRDATEVTLVVTEGGNGRDCDHGVWANPTFVRQ